MISRFDLRFHARPPRWRLTWTCVCLFAALNGALAWKTWQAAQHLHALREQYNQAGERMRQAVLAASAEALPLQAGLPATITARLSVPWESLLDTLARLTPPGVRVTRLAPDADNHTLQWVVESNDLGTVTAYMEALDSSAALRNVHLIQQEKPLQAVMPPGMAAAPVPKWQFTLRGEWPTSGHMPLPVQDTRLLSTTGSGSAGGQP